MKDTVYYYKVDSYEDKALYTAVNNILSQSEKLRTLDKDNKILIKPNLLAKHIPSHCVTTHPAVLRAVIRALKARGLYNITVADSPGGAYSAPIMRSIYKVSGLSEVCESENVKLYTECEWRSVKANGKLMREFSFLLPVADADFIINLPKLKTHVMTGMSGAVKNLFGCIPGLQKAELHMRFPDKDLFGDMLVDLYEALHPDINIIDGIMAMEGDGPAGGKPKNAALIIGGENGYEIDLTICKLIGLDAMEVPFLRAAHNRKLCGKASDTSCITGDNFVPIIGFALPKSYSRIDFGTKIPKPFRWLVPYAEKKLAPHPVIKRPICIGCGKCAEICPQNTIEIKDKKAHINSKECIRCFCCHEICPVKAIDVKCIGLFKI
ncbi:MAG: DUF362 domain-containing protein [Oscillospiraceae bacterium]